MNSPPNDLVLMPDDRSLSESERNHLLSAKTRWWLADDKVLLVSALEAAAGGVTAEDDPADGGIDVTRMKVDPIPDACKRWSAADGFYQA